MRLSTFLAAALAALALLAAPTAHAEVALSDINARIDAIMPRVVAWRRDIHHHPELGNRETRTAALVAAHLRRLGMEVRTGVAGAGVIGILHGGRPGPVVALRSELDALPVHEQTGLPFASTVQTQYNGQTTYVAHACGHDMHIAMLMGAAEVLAGLRAQIPGTIVFVFQPAEEGPPAGETGGASRLVAEGGLTHPTPSAIFGLHVVPGLPGTIFYRPQGFMAAADELHITLHGRQTHGAWPWQGIDVISLSSAIVSELNTVAARTVDVTRTPTVLSITAINGGNRWNIIPQDVTMQGTLRTFDRDQRVAIQHRVETTVRNLAASYGATADVEFIPRGAVTFNDPALTSWALPAMQEAAGASNVDASHAPTMVSEDFSYYQEHIPGLFVHLGASQDGVDPATSPPNHSPLFNPNERILPLGVRTHVVFALRYLESGGLPAR
jgi:amidohydrolase